MKKLNYSQIGFLIIGLVASATGRAQNGLMLTTVATLPYSDGPAGPLVQGNDGMLYGTTEGAFGTVFRITLSGSLTTLVSFNGTNGSTPQSSPILAPDGYFYGTTAWGTSNNYSGYNQGYGTIYRMDTNGVLITLFYFDQTNGVAPVGLTLGKDGSLYGIAGTGGPNFANSNNGDGTIFKISTNGDFTLLASFSGTNGYYPNNLIEASDGNFYGTTINGGNNDASGVGTVFRMTPDGQLTNLFVFNGTNGANPTSIIQASDGCLYGTTIGGGITNLIFPQQGEGVIFKGTTNGNFAVLAMFNETNGGLPTGLTEVSNGVFYGLAEFGGEYEYGTLFQLTTNGDLTALLSFGATPALPASAVGPLTKASDGNYYGSSWLLTTINNITYTTNIIFSIRPIQAPVLQPLAQGNQLNLSWNAWAGYSYNVMYETNLFGSNWTLLSTVTPQTNGPASYSDNIGSDAQRFYTVVLQLP